MCRTWSQSVHSICPENIIATVFAPGPYHYLCGWGMSQLKKLDEGMALATDLVETNKMNALGRALSERIHDAWWPRTQSALEPFKLLAMQSSTMVIRSCGSKPLRYMLGPPTPSTRRRMSLLISHTSQPGPTKDFRR